MNAMHTYKLSLASPKLKTLVRETDFFTLTLDTCDVVEYPGITGNGGLTIIYERFSRMTLALLL